MDKIINRPSFGSLYKYNITNSNRSDVFEAENEIYEKTNCELEMEYTSFPELFKTGIYAKSSLYADDKFDDIVESLLKQKGIGFTKVTREEALNFDNINNRIVIPPEYKNSNMELFSINVEKLDKLLQKDVSFYIFPSGKKGGISNRYNSALDYISTGKDINASILILYEDETGLCAVINDGRHRYSAMRDMGMKNINFAMYPKYINLAKKYNLE